MAVENEITKNELDEVVEANLDEVIEVGDPRHGVHDPLLPERDALAVHEGQTPEQVFGSPDRVDSQVDLPESDLDGADGRRGAVVRTLGRGVVDTPEQHFAEEAVEQLKAANAPAEDVSAAETAKAKADAKAKGGDGSGSRTSG